jgi:hypothetical protein
MKSIKFIPPEKDELLNGIGRYAGISDIVNKESRILETASLAAAKAIAAIRPLSIIEETPYKNINEDILTGEAISIQSKNLCMLALHMNTPLFIYGFALTLGNEIDSIISETQRTSLSDSLFFDAAGSFFAEHYASIIEAHLESALKKTGLEISSRFSPGYCDWEVGAGQKELFNFLNPEKIGLSLLDSLVMSPMKSVTGIIIAARRVDHKTPCAFCPKEKCINRRQYL